MKNFLTSAQWQPSITVEKQPIKSEKIKNEEAGEEEWKVRERDFTGRKINTQVSCMILGIFYYFYLPTYTLFSH